MARLGLASLAHRNRYIQVASVPAFSCSDWTYSDDAAPMQGFVGNDEASTRASLLVTFMRIEIERQNSPP